MRQSKSHVMNRALGRRKLPKNPRLPQKKCADVAERGKKEGVPFRVRSLTPPPNRPILQARDPALARTDVG